MVDLDFWKTIWWYFTFLLSSGALLFKILSTSCSFTDEITIYLYKCSQYQRIGCPLSTNRRSWIRWQMKVLWIYSSFPSPLVSSHLVVWLMSVWADNKQVTYTCCHAVTTCQLTAAGASSHWRKNKESFQPISPESMGFLSCEDSNTLGKSKKFQKNILQRHCKSESLIHTE